MVWTVVVKESARMNVEDKRILRSGGLRQFSYTLNFFVPNTLQIIILPT